MGVKAEFASIALATFLAIDCSPKRPIRTGVNPPPPIAVVQPELQGSIQISPLTKSEFYYYTGSDEFSTYDLVIPVLSRRQIAPGLEELNISNDGYFQYILKPNTLDKIPPDGIIQIMPPLEVKNPIVPPIRVIQKLSVRDGLPYIETGIQNNDKLLPSDYHDTTFDFMRFPIPYHGSPPEAFTPDKPSVIGITYVNSRLADFDWDGRKMPIITMDAQ
jgi:hypothetical protein